MTHVHVLAVKPGNGDISINTHEGKNKEERKEI